MAYHQKSATWSTTGVAIAPLIRASSQPADTADLRPLFWFRPDNKPQKLTSNAIVWAKETVNKPVGTRVSAVPQQFLKIVYGFQNPLPHLLQTFKTKPKEPFYDAWNEKPLSSTDRASLLAKTDTVWIYDDYEERPRIVHSEITAANISQLRLRQTWYWDDRRHRLSICLDAVAPLVDIRRYADDLRFQKPLFYRRARR